jgi:hypothetical protein
MASLWYSVCCSYFIKFLSLLATIGSETDNAPAGLVQGVGALKVLYYILT